MPPRSESGWAGQQLLLVGYIYTRTKLMSEDVIHRMQGRVRFEVDSIGDHDGCWDERLARLCLNQMSRQLDRAFRIPHMTRILMGNLLLCSVPV